MAVSEELQILLTILIFVTGLGALWIPIIGIGGLSIGLIMIPYLDAEAPGLMAFYVISCVINILFFIVGVLKGRKG